MEEKAAGSDRTAIKDSACMRAQLCTTGGEKRRVGSLRGVRVSPLLIFPMDPRSYDVWVLSMRGQRCKRNFDKPYTRYRREHTRMRAEMFSRYLTLFARRFLFFGFAIARYTRVSRGCGDALSRDTWYRPRVSALTPSLFLQSYNQDDSRDIFSCLE